MKRIVLISPLIPQHGERPHIPHSLLYLAAALQHRKDVCCEIIDYNVGDNVERFLGDPDVVFFGISCLTGLQLHSAKIISEHIKHSNRSALVVWGGIHVSLVPEESIKEPYIDIVVIGEGENTINDLINALLYRKPLSEVGGIAYSDGSQTVINPRSGFVDLDALPPLPYEMLDLSLYNRDVLWMITSRGCPHGCSFCVNSGLNDPWRSMSASTTVTHLGLYLESIKPRIVFFMDYNFFVDMKRVQEIAAALIDRFMVIRWLAQITGRDAVSLSRNSMKLLKESGCMTLVVGQDAAGSLMKTVHKPCSHKQILVAEKKLARSGISLTRNFIIGLQGERREDTQAVVRDIANIRQKYNSAVNIYVLCIWPGTPLAKHLEHDGYHTPHSINEWSRMLPGDASVLRFHSQSHHRYIITVYYTIRLLFRHAVFPSLPSLGTSGIFHLHGIFEKAFLYVCTVAAKIRWRIGWFGFGIEASLLDMLVKRKYSEFRRRVSEIHARSGG